MASLQRVDTEMELLCLRKIFLAQALIFGKGKQTVSENSSESD